MGGQGGCLLTRVAENNQLVMTWHIILSDNAHHIVLTSPALIWLVTWHCSVVVVLQCAMVIVGSRRALWVVVAVGEHGDAALVGIIDDGG